MKKLIITLSILTFSLTIINAQNWQWAREGFSYASDAEIFGTSINNNGDVFVAGYYQTQLMLAGSTLGSDFQGDNNSFIAKYDAAGNAIWCRNTSGVQPDANSAIAVSSDSLGNCYVVDGNGYISSTPGSLFNYASSYGGFHVLKKINSAGGDVWTQYPSFGASSMCTFEAMKTDGAGNTYLTGTFGGTVTFGSITLTSASTQDVLVVKYDANGNVIYAIQGTANGAAIGHGIDIDAAGGAVIVGEYQSGITFGTTTLVNNGNRDYFIARVTPGGTFQWAKGDGGNGYDALYGVAIDYPRIYVTGIFGANFTFGSIAVTTAGLQDILVACTDMSGNELFAKSNGGGSNDDIGYGVAVDHNGGVYFSGNYLGPATFGGTSLVGTNSAYLVKYDIIGTQQWTKTVSSNSMVVVSGKALSSNRNNELAMGSAFTYYGGPINFSTSSITLSCNGGPGNYGSGFYVAKLGNCTLTTNAGSAVSIPCSDTTLLTATGGTSFSWSPFAGLVTTNTASVQAHPVVTTTYTVTASDVSGCSATSTVTVTVTGGPTISLQGTTSICAGSSTQLTASGATTYVWSPSTYLDNATIANPTATPPLGTTTYTVTGTDQYGCANNTTVTITVNPLPTQPTISQNINVLSSTTATTYQWNMNGGAINGATNQTYTVTSNGIYTVTITNIYGCSITSAPYFFTNVGVNELVNSNLISIYPNPVVDESTVILNAVNTFQHPHLRVVDAWGRMVADESFTDNKILVKKNALAKGIYFYYLLDGEQMLATGKLMME